MSWKRRVLIAGLFHETHTFVDSMTSLKNFSILREEELFRCEGDSSPLGGALEMGRKFGWQIIPTVDFRAAPSGMVENEVVETFWREFESHARPEVASGIDGIFLVLHGAMVTPSHHDVEGEILERIRKLPGAEFIPIFGVFDLHANFTQRMATHANCLVAYRENPHTDARNAAQNAAALMERSFQTGQLPRTFWQHPPIMWPPTGTGTASEPMRSLEAVAREIEAAAKDIWCVNVLAGFSFADIPETGVSFTVTTTGSEAEACKALDCLAQLALSQKETGNVTEPPIKSILKNVLTDGLTVLVEPSDNIGGGAPGDGTGILRALIEFEITNAAICINDPEAVKKLMTYSPGSTVSLAIGGKGSRLDAGPLTLKVEFISLSDGKFELEDKQSHLASISGNYFDMGPSAVVKYKGISILLTSNKTPPFDLAQWRSQGIEPASLSVIGVKAAVAHRRAYDPIASRMIWVATPGPCSSNLMLLPFQNVKRPIYPLDTL